MVVHEPCIELEGQQLRYCGVGHKYDRVIVKGNPDELKVSD